MTGTVSLFITIVFILFVISFFLKIAFEYERIVLYTLGKFSGLRGPGLVFVIPIFQTIRKVDTRIITLDVPSQEVITRDNVTIRVNAVIYYQVMDANKAVNNVRNYNIATSQIAQTTLRSVLGEHELDDLLANREKINQTLQGIIDSQTDPWGIKVSMVEIKDVELPETMKRAMAKQAEAERERRAKIIAAEGEFQASKRLREAADVMAGNLITLQLRYLQTLVEVSAEKNSTTLFPIPIDFFKPFIEGMQKANSGS
ncbi:MAG TPA: slipin family protein [Firmicutes bacterium]|nr:slipin family protein [Bacillota bacterium]